MNKVHLIGNLTKDVELKTTQSGKQVCRFSIAVNRRFGNADGEKVTDFLNIVVWGKLAENCDKFLSKGKKVCVVGELQNRSWEDDKGVKHVSTEIVADEVEFLTPIDKSQHNENDGSATRPGSQQTEMKPITDDDLPF
jgi:single-strand DNA-binding protein